jgi:hypothetical protein
MTAPVQHVLRSLVEREARSQFRPGLFSGLYRSRGSLNLQSFASQTRGEDLGAQLLQAKTDATQYTTITNSLLHASRPPSQTNPNILDEWQAPLLPGTHPAAKSFLAQHGLHL